MRVMAMLCVGAVLVCGSAARAGSVNVAAGRPVTKLSGTFGGTPSAVTDGLFLPDTTPWNDPGTLNWQGSGMIQIDLGGLHSIDGAVVQADNNDSYLLQYHRLSDNTWQTFWNVPVLYPIPAWMGGLTTRPPSYSTSLWTTLPAVETDAVRFGDAAGDGFYSVSEIQLRGTAVPLPAAAWGGLALLGLLAACRLGRRQIA